MSTSEIVKWCHRSATAIPSIELVVWSGEGVPQGECGAEFELECLDALVTASAAVSSRELTKSIAAIRSHNDAGIVITWGSKPCSLQVEEINTLWRMRRRIGPLPRHRLLTDLSLEDIKQDEHERHEAARLEAEKRGDA